MSTQSLASRWAGNSAFRNFPRYAGAAVVLTALLVIASWYAHWSRVLQMVPGSAPMQYNTALCFVFLGAGLLLLTLRRPRAALLAAALSAGLAGLTLLEYLGHWDLGIDELFHKPFFEAQTAYPGRMSPLAAVCFTFMGAAVALCGTRRPSARRITAAAALSCVAGVIAFVALLGFAAGIEPAYSWGSYSAMAVNTALVFIVVSTGVIGWSWQLAARINTNFLRWLPLVGSVTLMAMVTVVAAVNVTELKAAAAWRRHTIQVVLRAQAFEENITDTQRGIRGYVTLADAGALASYRAGLALEPQMFSELTDLTSDNAAQQRRLERLAAAVQELFAYDRRTLDTYEKAGADAVRVLDATGESRRLYGDARNTIREFSQEEEQLLFVRDASEKADTVSAGRLLIFGSLLAAALLIVANVMVGREMRHRQRVEVERERLIDELRRALEEVKSLSGMIPICGWCKSIRSDEGYWQSVEQYVREHTDVTFTHGICPTCAEKFKAEALAAAKAP